jgi:hypothetical protein
MSTQFSADDAIVAADEDTGDVAIYAGGSAASFCGGVWRPDIVFNYHDLFSRDSRFSAVEDPAEVQRYLDAARNALVEHLATLDAEEADG